jgi:hypothetical protein
MVALLSLLAKTKPKCNKNATATQAKKETIAVACPTTVPGELVAGLGGVLCVVFVAFAQNVGTNVQGIILLFCLVS